LWAIINKYKGNEMSGVVTKRRPVEPIKKSERGRYQTRDGRPVTVLATGLRLALGDSITGVIHYPDHDETGAWQADGQWDSTFANEHSKDLVETVESGSVTKWVTYYPKPERLGSVYNSEREAKAGGQPEAIVVPIQIPSKDKIVIVT
jgi:hypothetical protein